MIIMKSPFKCGWAWIISSMPSLTPSEKSAAARFRRYLRETGWFKLAAQVWARPCPRSSFGALVKEVAPYVPPAANVRLIWITDYQWGESQVIVGMRR